MVGPKLGADPAFPCESPWSLLKIRAHNSLIFVGYLRSHVLASLQFLIDLQPPGTMNVHHKIEIVYEEVCGLIGDQRKRSKK